MFNKRNIVLVWNDLMVSKQSQKSLEDYSTPSRKSRYSDVPWEQSLVFPSNWRGTFIELISHLRTKLNKGRVSVRWGDCTWILVTLSLLSSRLFMEWDTTVSVLQMCALKRYQASSKVYQPDASVAEWETAVFLHPCHPYVDECTFALLFCQTRWHAEGD